jgi:hypothetical protein
MKVHPTSNLQENATGSEKAATLLGLGNLTESSSVKENLTPVTSTVLV